MKTSLWKTISAATLLATAWTIALPASAQTVPVEPTPDWITLVFPTLVRKAGNTTADATRLAPGNIRHSYETRFENYWKETSYYRFDSATGEKLHGFYSDSKTYGYVEMPWPIQPRPANGAATLGTMEGDTFTDGVRRYSANVNFTPDAADTDGVWTPGESFNDLNGNRQWDPAKDPEDYWDNNNIQINLQKRDALGTPTGDLGAPSLTEPYSNAVQNPNPGYSAQAGELFADYNNNHATRLDPRNVGFDSSVTLWVADGAQNRSVTISELDLSPQDDASINEGDFAQTMNDNGVIGPTVPANGAFDCTTTTADIPQVVAATYFGGTALTVQYTIWVRVEQNGTVTPYLNANPLPTPDPAAGDTWVNQLAVVSVPVYQARELYGVAKPQRQAGINLFGDVVGDPAIVAADNQWTAGTPAEPFEDFLSWEGKGLEGQANPRGRVLQTQDEYELYINWNYPGNAAAKAALIARAGNGVYDGPENWVDAVNNKLSLGAREETTPEPMPWNPVTKTGNFDADLGYATWQDWYRAAFGNNDAASSVPAYWDPDGDGQSNPQPIPTLTVYTPQDEPANGAAGWIPVTTWSFDSPREFCDMPSSIYHLGGTVDGAVTLVNLAGTPFADLNPQVDPYTQFVPVRLRGGDYALGEITSPYNDLISGHDLHPDSPNGDNPSGPDKSIPAAGPLMFNTIAGNGYDGANQVAMELLSRRTDGDPDLDTHPVALRDTNLDGILDAGSSRTGDPHYSTGSSGDAGGDGSGAYPFNRQRYMEDVIAIWDQMEDFNYIHGRIRPGETRGIYAYPIYPVNPNDATGGWAALGGPAGANIDVFTRDTGDNPISIWFQVRPLNGAGVTDAEQTPPPDVNQNVEPEVQDYGMGLLCHEQGHDIFHLPDLYDYDVWQTPKPAINSPIAGYDLMAGGMVHGVADMKELAGANRMAEGDANGIWTQIIEISSMLTNDTPVVVEMYPAERVPDQYYRLRKSNNPDNPGYHEYLDFWFLDNRNAAEEGPSDPPGGRGVYVCHVDKYSDPTALPRQQRVNGHFVWEIIQADGLSQLQDGVNGGDAGDPFPGNTDNRTFTPQTTPAARWWDWSDAGIRILDVQLPAVVGQPARVTLQRVFGTAQAYTRLGADTDADGIPDWWEFQYFQNLNVVDGTTDWDSDGLLDIGEFRTNTNPRLADVDKNGLSDGLEDADGDGISNADETRIYGTDPLAADTDDDGIGDIDEIFPLDLQADGRFLTSPVYGRSPLIERSLTLDGATEIAVPSGVASGTDDRFDVASWTVEAWVYLTTTNQTGALVRRVVDQSGWTAFELGLDANMPYIKFQTSAINWAWSGFNAPIPTNEWTHLAGVWDAATKSVKLYVNGVSFSGQVVNGAPASGRGHTILGGTVQCHMDELRLWSVARTAAELTSNYLRIINTPTGVNGLIANYRFDDGGATAEDSMHPLDWAYALATGSVTDNPAMALLGMDDADNDGMPTWWENLYGAPLDPAVADNAADADVDGLTNIYEYWSDTNPLEGDTDNDGEPDTIEDYDGDGLQNAQEQTRGSHAGIVDTDDDGTPDYQDPNPASSLVPATDLVLQLDGSANSYVQLPRQSRFALGTYSLMAWVKPAITNGEIIAREVKSGSYNYVLRLNGLRPEISYTSGGTNVVTATSLGSIPTNVWTHVAGVFNPAQGRLIIYTNGVQAISKATNGKLPDIGGVGPERVRIGRGFKGLIEDTAIFSTAADAAALARFMTAIDPAEAGLVSRYTFDDGTSAVGPDAMGNWNGTSRQSLWSWGQVQEFATGYDSDWLNAWRNAGTLRGHAVMAEDLTDSNRDGIPDWWETANGVANPAGPSIAHLDWDNDGVPNIWEYRLHSDPQNDTSIDPDQVVNDGDWDSDGDDLSNREEIHTWGTFPNLADTDDDGIPDGDEVRLQGVPENPSVAFVLPANEFTTADRQTTVAGTVTNGVDAVWIYNNGQFITKATVTTGGIFSAVIPVDSGVNQLTAVGFQAGVFKSYARLTINGEFSAVDIRVTAYWTAPGDLDIWLIDPQLRHMGWTPWGPPTGFPGTWNHITGTAGRIPGALLFFDDQVLTGPENLVVPRGSAVAGSYDVWVHNFTGKFYPEARVRVLVNENTADERVVEFGPIPVPTPPVADPTNKALYWCKIGTLKWPEGTFTSAYPEKPVETFREGQGAPFFMYDPLDSLAPAMDRVLDLDGQPGSYVELPDRTRFGNVTNFTFRAAVKPWVRNGTLIERQVAPGKWNYQVNLLANGTVQALFSPVGSPTNDVVVVSPVANALPVGAWSQVAVTHDSSQLAIWINGVVVASNMTARVPMTSGAGPLIHRLGSGFSGQMDEVALYKAAITNTGAVAQPDSSLLAYYRFNDGTSAGDADGLGLHYGTSLLSTLWRGQVEDFTRGLEFNWEKSWADAGTLKGGAYVGEPGDFLPTYTGFSLAPDYYADAVNAGIARLWLETYFPSPTAMIDPAALCKNGASIYNNYVTLTDPTGTDVFKLSITKAANQTTLAWPGHAGRLYTIEYASSMVANDWASPDAWKNLTSSGDTQMTLVDDGSKTGGYNSRRVYRAQVKLP